jgi:hypothetical protein
MARKWYLWIQQDVDYGNYLWDREDDIDLTCIGAIMEIVVVPKEIRPTKRITYVPTVKYDDEGKSYAENERRISWIPSYESFCKYGTDHELIESDVEPVYKCKITQYAWTISFSSLEDLEQFLIDYEPEVALCYGLSDYCFVVHPDAWEAIQRKLKENQNDQ